MKYWKNIIVSLSLILLLYACVEKRQLKETAKDKKITSREQEITMPPVQEIDNKGIHNYDNNTLLSFNGETIPLKEFNQDYQFYLSQNPDIKDSPETKRDFLNKYIKDNVIQQQAQSLKMDKDDNFKIRLRNVLRNLLVDYYCDVLKTQTEITEDELKNYYDSHIQEYTIPEMRKVSIITNNSLEAINEAKKSLNKGDDWAKVAEKFSIHPSKEKGGEINEYFKRGDKNKKFEDVAFSLKVSEISDIVQIDSVYYIIKVTGKKESVQKQFSEVRDDIRKKILDEKKKKTIDNLILNSQIEINESLLK